MDGVEPRGEGGKVFQGGGAGGGEGVVELEGWRWRGGGGAGGVGRAFCCAVGGREREGGGIPRGFGLMFMLFMLLGIGNVMCTVQGV